MAKRGPKSHFPVPPIDLSGLPNVGGDRIISFIEQFIRITKGTGARQPFRVRPWQREIIHGLFDEPRPRQGLVSIPAGNGKSSLAAALGMYGLVADGVEGAQVICVASDQRQAGIIFNTCRRMVELNDALAEVQIYSDKLYVPRTDATLMALPAEPAALEGWDPSLAIVDELHVVTSDTYETVAAREGKREQSPVLAISTPPRDGNTDNSIMWRLVELGRDGLDPSFYFKEYAAPEGCATDDEQAWRVANPALHDFLHVDALRATHKTMRESRFRAYRLGQWPRFDAAWLPSGAWEACGDADLRIENDEPIVLGFDGSFNGDVTVLVACTIERRPHIEILNWWEASPEDSKEWRVPILEVEEAIRQACLRFDVREVACDPFRWSRTIEILEGEGLPMLVYAQSPQRMMPGAKRFYEAVTNRMLTHSADPRLARHVGNCVLRENSRGAMLAKEHKMSRRRIDAAVAAVMALDRATANAAEVGMAGVVLLD